MNIAKIDFGIIKKYYTDRGFGFISHTFLNTRSKEVFFHIKKIKTKHPNLARILDNVDSIGTIYFWYEIEDSKKGEQVSCILNPNNIHQEYAINLPAFIEKIECIWRDINSKVPDWLNQVTIDLVGASRAHELSIERDSLELQRIEDTRAKKIMEEQRAQQEIEDNEFKKLIAEMSSLGFTHSQQVSLYIMRNRLGYKYKNISGVVKMQKEGNTWNFKGGFSTLIYAQICSELNLDNQGSRARVVGFNSFKKLAE